MTKLTATFDGPQLKIDADGKLSYHQLFVASRELERLAGSCSSGAGAEKTVAIIEFFGYYVDPLISTEGLSRGQHLALASELYFAAQASFNAPTLNAIIQGTVQATLQAMAEQAQNQQIMSKVKMTKGGVAVPH